MQYKLLLALTFAALTHGMPAMIARDGDDQITTNPVTGGVADEDSPNYLNADGTSDLLALIAAAATPATDLDSIPTVPTNLTVPVDVSALNADAVSQGLAQATGSSLSKRSDVGGAGSGVGGQWTDYPTCTNAAHPELFSSSPIFPQALTYAQFTTAAVPTFVGASSAAAVASAVPSAFNLAYSSLDGTFQPANVGNSFLGAFAPATYDVAACASRCQNDLAGQCAGFNIYFERDPTTDPNSDYAPNYSECSDPPSLTNVVCLFWGVPVDTSSATNTYQFRGNYFKTAHAGSNGYNILGKGYVPKTIPGFTYQITPGILANQIATGSSKNYPDYKTNTVAATTVLTGTFDVSKCSALATNSYYAGKVIPKGQNIKTYQGAYQGQGCILYTTTKVSSTAGVTYLGSNYPLNGYNDAGQYDAAGNYYSRGSVYNYWPTTTTS
ncbi:hypothetical protein CBS101457_004966 [Exobasidium rhododendri]|nr:hypothetical protein CBS101457_004966 [Exobasidium rhododendri]